MKKILGIIVIAFICGFLANMPRPVMASNDTLETIERGYGYSIFCDKETGVEYIGYTSGYGRGITVRYNADGSVKISKGKKE